MPSHAALYDGGPKVLSCFVANEAFSITKPLVNAALQLKIFGAKNKCANSCLLLPSCWDFWYSHTRCSCYFCNVDCCTHLFGKLICPSIILFHNLLIRNFTLTYDATGIGYPGSRNAA